ncbi:NAD(P)-binding protein [Trametopsis cervina]|nr:NAD(P)-binding protein [Trametopsis cervina]
MITQAFANNGARVYIVGRRTDVLLKSAETWGSSLAHPKGQLIPLRADITSKESIERLAKEVASGNERHQQAENSAQALKNALWKESWDNWETTYRTNALLHDRRFPPPARRSEHVRLHRQRTTQHHFMYNVSKAATIQLKTLFAQELTKPGVNIRVNSIAPGIFPSQITTDGKDENNKSQIPTGSADEYREKKGIPAGRAEADDVMAQTALFLACNQYIYGQTVDVDGGYLLEHP